MKWSNYSIEIEIIKAVGILITTVYVNGKSLYKYTYLNFLLAILFLADWSPRIVLKCCL